MCGPPREERAPPSPQRESQHKQRGGVGHCFRRNSGMACKTQGCAHEGAVDRGWKDLMMMPSRTRSCDPQAHGWTGLC